jgi:hypothetical protein
MQDLWLKNLDQFRELGYVLSKRCLGPPRRCQSREDPVIGHAMNLYFALRDEMPLENGEARSRHHMWIKARSKLRTHDVVGANRVSGLHFRQRISDDVQDAPWCLAQCSGRSTKGDRC